MVEDENEKSDLIAEAAKVIDDDDLDNLVITSHKGPQQGDTGHFVDEHYAKSAALRSEGWHINKEF